MTYKTNLERSASPVEEECFNSLHYYNVFRVGSMWPFSTEKFTSAISCLSVVPWWYRWCYFLHVISVASFWYSKMELCFMYQTKCSIVKKFLLQRKLKLLPLRQWGGRSGTLLLSSEENKRVLLNEIQSMKQLLKILHWLALCSLAYECC